MSEWRVLIGSKSFGRSFPEHLEQLRAAGCEVIPNERGRAYVAAELHEALAGVDAIITGTDELTAEVIARAERLRTIAKHGVGLDSVDLAAARARGIIVSFTPGSMHDSVADMTLALLLALARQIVPADAAVRGGTWSAPVGVELRGRTLGVVGLGRIGKGVATRAAAFGMQVIAHDPYADAPWAEQHGVELVPLEQLLERSDVVSLHVATEAGDGPILDRDRIAAMRPGACLVNTARGALVDEPALVEALIAGRIAGAGLDVFATEPPPAGPLLTLPNVVLSPHIAGQTAEALRRMGDVCVENVLRALRGEPPLAAA